MIEYITVRLGDLWKFTPRSRKMLILGFISLVAAISIPTAPIPADIPYLLIAAILSLFGFWCVFYGVYCLFAEQFKLRRNQG